MPDGWELAYGLDQPTHGMPCSMVMSMGFDSMVVTNLTDGGQTSRSIVTLLERRKATIPPCRIKVIQIWMDSWMEAEFFGYFLSETNFDCYYNAQLVYTCDETLGEQARTTYSTLNSIDVGTDPTVLDTDGDGMPDGWEIEHRRWVGTSFTGGNNWSLDPTRADDAAWDADQDGLANLCEYQWSLVREAGLRGDLFEEFGESPESVATWSIPDPNPR